MQTGLAHSFALRRPWEAAARPGRGPAEVSMAGGRAAAPAATKVGFKRQAGQSCHLKSELKVKKEGKTRKKKCKKREKDTLTAQQGWQAGGGHPQSSPAAGRHLLRVPFSQAEGASASPWAGGSSQGIKQPGPASPTVFQGAWGFRWWGHGSKRDTARKSAKSSAASGWVKRLHRHLQWGKRFQCFSRSHWWSWVTPRGR